MRLIIFVSLLARASAYADDNEPPPNWLKAPPAAPIKANPAAMTAAGGIMVPVGVASVILGGWFVLHNLFACGLYDDGCTPAQTAAINRDDSTGAGLMIGGFFTLGIGAALLGVGVSRLSDERDRARKKRELISLTPYAAPQPGGAMVGAVIRF